MKRIKLLLAALGIVVASFGAFSGPAMADDCDFRDRGNRDDVIVCRGDDFDDDFFIEDGFDDDFFFDPFFFDGFFFDDFGFVSDCPFAGDFEGPINQFDCFD